MVRFRREAEAAAFAFVNSFADDKIVDYVRVERLLTRLHQGNLAAAEADYQAFENHRLRSPKLFNLLRAYVKNTIQFGNREDFLNFGREIAQYWATQLTLMQQN